MSELVFLFGVHNHQPVGNFSSVLERAFRDCYRPFLEEMAGHPSLKFTLHFSGPLWEYMESRQKDCWALLRELVARRQVELLGGGFYEPILAIVPEEDRQGQLRLMQQFLKEKFDVEPRGVWLAERVWEPHLARTLAQAGFEYTLLDEEHFHYAGIENIHAAYVTEEEGHPLVLFPIDKKLRYLIPFREIGEVRAYLGQVEKRGGLAILADDGEKFGLWPGTRQWVYEEKWLKTFLSFLEAEPIQMMTYSEYLDTQPRLDLAYLPPASYEEMMEWVLEPGINRRLQELKKSVPPEARRLLRGGFFREFFLKYPESNHLHKRMLHLSREINKEKRRNEAACRQLYQAQCNDAYWHGVFGGLYLPHLREAVYFHLLEAEKKSGLQAGWERTDYDFDGKEEIFYRDSLIGLLFKPSFGGSLVEFDLRTMSRNLSNVLARREESYHHPENEAAGEGKSIHELARKLPPTVASLLRYDWHPRYSLLDHFLHPGTTEEDFSRLDYGEQGDFVNQEYTALLDSGQLYLRRQGHVWQAEKRVPVQVEKRVVPEKGVVRFASTIENLGQTDLHVLFGSEWNFYLLPNEWETREEGIRLLGGKVELFFSPAPEIWHFPLQTLSQSEEGYDIIHQGMCCLPHWRFSLPAGQKFSLAITLKVEHER